MIVYIIGQNFDIKNTAASDSGKYRIVDDRVTMENVSCTCEITIQYKGRFSNLCNVGDFLYIPSRDIYSNFFQIISTEVDYSTRTATLYGDNSLLLLYSQRAGSGGPYGCTSYAGKSIEWFLEDFTTGARFPFTIKINELSGILRTGTTEATTAKESLDKTAELFNCEIAFSYSLENNTVKPYIEIYEEQNGRETGEILTMGKELSSLSKSEDCSGVISSVYIRGKVKPEKIFAEDQSEVSFDIGTVYIAGGKPYKVFELQQVVTPYAMIEKDVVYRLVVSGSTLLGYYFGDPVLASNHAAHTSFKAATGWVVTNGFAAVLDDSYIQVDEGYETADAEEAYNNQSVITPLPDYDSGDYFASKEGNTSVSEPGHNVRLVSRSAWGRFGAPDIGASATGFGAEIAYKAEDIETATQEDVLNAAIAILEEYKTPVITFDCECNKRVEIGAYYTLCVPDEGVYISARCLSIEESETAGTYKPTFGNFIVKENAFEIMARNAKGGF